MYLCYLFVLSHAHISLTYDQDNDVSELSRGDSFKVLKQETVSDKDLAEGETCIDVSLKVFATRAQLQFRVSFDGYDATTLQFLTHNTGKVRLLFVSSELKFNHIRSHYLQSRKSDMPKATSPGGKRNRTEAHTPDSVRAPPTLTLISHPLCSLCREF